MKVHRTIVTTLHVVFARPDEFDWSATQTFRDHRRFTLHVRVSHGAPAKTTAGHLGVESDLLGFQSEHFSDGHLIKGLKLRTGPHLRAITIEAHGRVQWLHRCMRKKRKLILSNEPV